MSTEGTDAPMPPSHPDYKRVMGTLQPDDWATRWKYMDTHFHQGYVDKELQMFIGKLINRRENVKVFVPLCGKSLDMKWLADIGCTVVGLEISTDAIEQFFNDSNLEYTTEKIEAIPATLYKSLDNKNQIYCCDLFSISSDFIGQFGTVWDKASFIAINFVDIPSDFIGQFGTVWDRASFAAINFVDVPRYVSLMKSLLLPNARYFLSSLNFDGSKYEGPPHCHSDEEIKDLFGDTMSVEKLCEEDLTDAGPAQWFNLDWITSYMFLMVNQK